MMSEVTVSPATKLRGTINIPPDKSISHRALIIGSMASGQTEIENLLEAKDVLSTLNCLRQLGVDIKKENSKYVVSGVGKRGFSKSQEVLDVGNSGTTLRILPGLLAGQNFEATLSGDESVNSRPMERVLKPLKLMGAKTSSTDSCAPVTVGGGELKGIDYRTEVPSAQVKSAIILAGLLAEGKTTVREEYKSRDHTELMLQCFGADIKTSDNSVTVDGSSELKGQKITIPRDFSSAAYFLAAGLMVPEASIQMRGIGVNKQRTGLINVLKRMGCTSYCAVAYSKVCNEEVADFTAEYAELQATDVEKYEIPSLIDELPVFAVIATQADGKTVVSGAEELRVKETDRIKNLVSELKKMNAEIKEKPDGFVIQGPTNLKGAVVDSRGDHRLAMSLAVAALVARGETTIKNAEAVDVSFPGFFDVIKSLT